MAMKHKIKNGGTWKYILFCLAFLVFLLSFHLADRIRNNPREIYHLTIPLIILTLIYAVGISSARAGNRFPLVNALIFGLPISFLSTLGVSSSAPYGTKTAVEIITYFFLLPFSVILGLLFSLWTKNDEF